MGFLLFFFSFGVQLCLMAQNYKTSLMFTECVFVQFFICFNAVNKFCNSSRSGHKMITIVKKKKNMFKHCVLTDLFDLFGPLKSIQIM